VEAPAAPHNPNSNKDRNRDNGRDSSKGSSKDSRGSPTSKDNPTNHIQIPQKSRDHTNDGSPRNGFGRVLPCFHYVLRGFHYSHAIQRLALTQMLPTR